MEHIPLMHEAAVINLQRNVKGERVVIEEEKGRKWWSCDGLLVKEKRKETKCEMAVGTIEKSCKREY